MISDDPAILDFLSGAGLMKAGGGRRLTPLTGGVASDIWKVETGDRVFVVKRALAKLRVAGDWRAPMSRNASEVDWLRTVGAITPGAVPRVLAHDPVIGAFAMEFLDPADHPVWKSELLAGRADVAFAGRLGETLASIHRATAGDAAVAARFATGETFHAIRLEPYLEATARAHPDLAEPLFALSRDTRAKELALVHGDVSPKNILVGPGGPVILDAECAWYGDPAFDLAFCLNHLLLKAIAAPNARDALADSFARLAARHLAGVTWEAPDDLEARAARLLPALLLARVDGKSPVEYMTREKDRDRARRVARPLILHPPARLADVARAWYSEIAP